jgi:hypothetical protein
LLSIIVAVRCDAWRGVAQRGGDAIQTSS